MKLNIEIRPGEGGQDAQLLTMQQAGIYIEHAKNINASYKLTSSVG